MTSFRPNITRNTPRFGVFRPFWRPSDAVTLRRRRIPVENIAHSNQVIGRESKVGLRRNPVKATEFRFPEAAEAKHLSHRLAILPWWCRVGVYP